ncbi:MAG: hypothetical protein ACYC6C_13305 [Coriobacteriia bacterium]
MRTRRLVLTVVWATAAALPRVAWAGMPSVTLSDWATTRVETISFFVVAFLVSAAGARWLWNGLARNFERMPRLGYGSALAAVGLVGTLLVVVLTMIAGARELLTPGAWQKQGVLYRVGAAQPDAAAPADPERLAARKKQLESLRAELWKYAEQHDWRFPERIDSGEVPTALREMPGSAGLRYLYVPGLRAEDSPRVLVFEPEVYGTERLVLRANGEIASVSSAELGRLLPEAPQ